MAMMALLSGARSVFPVFFFYHGGGGRVRVKEEERKTEMRKMETNSRKTRLEATSHLFLATFPLYYSHLFFVFPLLFLLSLSSLLPSSPVSLTFSGLACGYVVTEFDGWRLVALGESVCDRVVVVWSDGAGRPAAVPLQSGSRDENGGRGSS